MDFDFFFGWVTSTYWILSFKVSISSAKKKQELLFHLSWQAGKYELKNKIVKVIRSASSRLRYDASDESRYTKWRRDNGTLGQHIVSEKVNKVISGEKKKPRIIDTWAETKRENPV